VRCAAASREGARSSRTVHAERPHEERAIS
jgi:hypothetical protein